MLPNCFIILVSIVTFCRISRWLASFSDFVALLLSIKNLYWDLMPSFWIVSASFYFFFLMMSYLEGFLDVSSSSHLSCSMLLKYYSSGLLSAFKAKVAYRINVST